MILMALRMSHAGVRQDIAGLRKLKAECPHLCWQRGAGATRTGGITARYLQDYKSEEIIAAMKPKANVDYNICHPEKCSVDGVCPATRHCEKKILRQEQKGEPPIQFGPCLGCSVCSSYCPLKAIKMF
jgi:Pyruvate/2-oxoacid:ferredoxin oxidoreductase delta subunit